MSLMLAPVDDLEIVLPDSTRSVVSKHYPLTGFERTKAGFVKIKDDPRCISDQFRKKIREEAARKKREEEERKKREEERKQKAIADGDRNVIRSAFDTNRKLGSCGRNAVLVDDIDETIPVLKTAKAPMTLAYLKSKIGYLNSTMYNDGLSVMLYGCTIMEDLSAVFGDALKYGAYIPGIKLDTERRTVFVWTNKVANKVKPDIIFRNAVKYD